ncbi:MAG: TIGR02206 family membrane protein [Candidatus Ancillula sp.]|nr:TIGR02206 family membrane protein [Candidatus Ancillula sp.]
MNLIYPQPHQPFDSFGLGHCIAMAVIFLGMISIAIFRKKLQNSNGKIILRNIFIVILAIVQIYAFVWNYFWGNLLKEMLPLHLCGAIFIPILIYPFAKGFLKQYCAELIFFWGMLGGSMATIFPNPEGQNFPHTFVLQTFIFHGIILWFAIYLVCVEKLELKVISVVRVIFSTIGLSVFAEIANHFIGSNYLFLNGNVEGVSTPLDLFGTGITRYIGLVVAFSIVQFIIFGIYKLFSSKQKISPAYNVVNG